MHGVAVVCKFALLLSIFMVLQGGLVLPTAAEETDFTQFGLEDLMEMEVYSVSRKSESLTDAAAAIFVITDEDIRLNGIRSIPEALRLAPGLQIAHVDEDFCAVSARGFNALFANKLLVLVDGRSIYTPLFSGVYWGNEGVPIEDIKQIEVIRGPGATLWGANAVNGVINIITKSASETQGLWARALTSRLEDARTLLRYGGSAGENIHYRIGWSGVFGADLDDASHNKLNDDQAFSGRLDWAGDGRDAASLRFGYFQDSGWSETTAPSFDYPFVELLSGETDYKLLYTQLSWRRNFSATSSLDLRLALDDDEQTNPSLTHEGTNIHVDLQNSFSRGSRQELVWGLGYNRVSDDIVSSFSYCFTPPSRTTEVWSAFIQDRIAFHEDRLHLVLGSKFEANDYTDFEIQPNLRCIWTPTSRQSLWAAVSRAVRTPSRIDSDARYNISVIPANTPTNPGNLPVLVAAMAGKEIKSEEVIAYEAGFRGFLKPNLSVDLALFYNDYDKLRSTTLRDPFVEMDPSPIHLVMPIELTYEVQAQSHGLELSAEWWLSDMMRIVPSYTYFSIDVKQANTGLSSFQDLADLNSAPMHQFGLRALIHPFSNFDCSLFFRSVGEIEDLTLSSYEELNVNLIWRPLPGFALSVGGVNLLEDAHEEFVNYGPDFGTNSALRSYIFKLSLSL